jgi:alpha-beta hydrolase superfamily lysophospholipase
MLDEAYSEKGWKTVNKKMEIFLLSGGDDPCTKNGSSLEITEGIFRNTGYTHIRSKIYPDMRHEILNEKEKMLVWNDIKDFIVNHPSFYHVP